MKTASIVLGALLCAGLARADDFSLESLPESLEAFEAVQQQWQESAEGAGAAFVVALCVYVDNETLGVRCLSLAMHDSRQQAGPRGVGGREPMPIHRQSWQRNLLARPYVARSYLVGTTPAGGYSLPEGNLTIRMRTQPRDMKPDSGKVFVASSGADSDRPLKVKKNEAGVWRVSEWSSLEVGVRAPE